MVREWGGLGMRKRPTEVVGKTEVGTLRRVGGPSAGVRGG